MAKQSLAMMVFMAMVSEGYAVRVGAKTEAQDALLKAIDSKFKDKEEAVSFKFIDLKPLKTLINGLNDAETLDDWQVGSLEAIAEELKVDPKVIGAVSSEVKQSQKAEDNVLSAIKSQLRAHQSSQSGDGPTVVSDTKTTMLREIETKVKHGKFADTIRELVTDEASAKSFVADLLQKAEENADMKLQQSAQKNRVHEVESAFQGELYPLFPSMEDGNRLSQPLESEFAERAVPVHRVLAAPQFAVEGGATISHEEAATTAEDLFGMLSQQKPEFHKDEEVSKFIVMSVMENRQLLAIIKEHEATINLLEAKVAQLEFTRYWDADNLNWFESQWDSMKTKKKTLNALKTTMEGATDLEALKAEIRKIEL